MKKESGKEYCRKATHKRGRRSVCCATEEGRKGKGEPSGLCVYVWTKQIEVEREGKDGGVAVTACFREKKGNKGRSRCGSMGLPDTGLRGHTHDAGRMLFAPGHGPPQAKSLTVVVSGRPVPSRRRRACVLHVEKGLRDGVSLRVRLLCRVRRRYGMRLRVRGDRVVRSRRWRCNRLLGRRSWRAAHRHVAGRRVKVVRLRRCAGVVLARRLP